MRDPKYFVTVVADSWNAMLIIGKIGRLSERYGLTGNIHVEPGDSIKFRFEVDTEETIDRAKRIVSKKKQVRIQLEVEPLGFVGDLFDKVLKQVFRRQKKTKVLGYGHVVVVKDESAKDIANPTD